MADNYLIGNVSGDIAHFRTALEEPLESCKVSFEPIQAGSGDPSPSNVRAISGWNGVSVTRCGKNLYDQTARLGGYINASGTVVPDASSYHSPLIPVEVGKTYTFSGSAPGTASGTGNKRLHGYNANGVWVQQLIYTSVAAYTQKDYAVTATIPSGIAYVAISYLINDSDVMLEQSESATTYEAYNGNNYTVSWQTSAGDVYGGYVDLVTGELVETWHSMTLAEIGAIDLGYNSGGYFFATISDRFGTYKKKVGTANVKCNVYKYENASSPSVFTDYSMRGTGGSGAIFWKDSRYTTVSSLVSNEGNNIIFCWELDTPIHYQLTPQQINTFKGANNFWSEAGTIDVSYCFKDAPEMLKLRRQIELSSPHVESTIGEIANFKADMAAPLKSCKVSFEPIQAGEGDPSPDNIRAISGWNGVSVKKCAPPFYRYIPLNKNLHIVHNGITIDHVGGGKYHVYGTLTATGSFPIIECEPFICPSETGRMLNWNNPVGTNFYFKNDNNGTEIDYWSMATANRVTGYGILAGKRTDGFHLHIDDSQTAYIGTTYNFYIMPEFYIDSNLSIFQVDWQSIVGTVYGGYVDFVTGELVKTWAMKHVSGNEFWYIDKYDGLNKNNRAYVTNFGPRGMTSRQIISDKITYSTQAYPPPVNCGKINENGVLMIGVPDTMDTSEDVNAWIQSIGGFDVAYPLDAPVRYQLDPQKIRSFIGTNNIWSNAGIVDVKYWSYHKDKRTAVWWNQLSRELNTSNWRIQNANYGTVTFENGIAKVTVTQDTTNQYMTAIYSINNAVINWDASHLYYLRQEIKSSDEHAYVSVFGSTWRKVLYVKTNEWTELKVISTPNLTGTGSLWINYPSTDCSAGQTHECRRVNLVDLTLMFGAGNEPATAEEFEQICMKNGVDLTQAQPYDAGTPLTWIV